MDLKTEVLCVFHESWFGYIPRNLSSELFSAVLFLFLLLLLQIFWFYLKIMCIAHFERNFELCFEVNSRQIRKTSDNAQSPHITVN